MTFTRPNPAAWIAALVAATLLAACGGGDGATEPPVRQIAFSQVDSTTNSGVTTPRNVVIRDPRNFALLWAEHTAPRNPVPPQPNIGFPDEAVAGVFLGQVPACTRPSIESIALSDAVIRVSYRVIPPGPAELCAAVQVTPALLVRFIAGGSTLPVEFVRLP